jgi:hypothetical protein
VNALIISMSAPPSPHSNIRTADPTAATDSPTSSSTSEISHPPMLSLLQEAKTHTPARDREDDERTVAATVVADSRDDMKTDRKLRRMTELAKLRMLLSESQKFSGEGNKSVRQWINTIEDTLLQLTDNDQDRAFIAKGWLVGVAQQTIINEANRRKLQGEPEMSWKDVKQYLIQTFDMGNSSELAIQHLTALKMNSSNMSSVAAYNIEWYKYLQYINTDEWDSSAITTIYINGLWSRIKMELIKIKHASRRLNAAVSAPTLMQLMKEAVEIESMIREMGQSYQSSSTERRGNRHATQATGNSRVSASTPLPMAAKTPNIIKVHNISETSHQSGEEGTEDVEGEEYEQEEGKDHTLSAVSSSSSQSSPYGKSAAASSMNKKPNTQYLTLEERSKLMQLGRCFRCYKTGHTKRSCTEVPATGRPDFTRLK